MSAFGGEEALSPGVQADGDGDATEVAQMFAQRVVSRGFDEDAATDLLRLLAHDLAAQPSARLRLGHLGLLIELLGHEDRDEPFVTSTEYEAEVVRRAALGERHPQSKTLRVAYGHWFKAVEAAANFLLGSGGARVKHSYRYARYGQGYEVSEILRAFLRCRQDLGAWPTEWEYHEWATLQRRLSRTDPRVPSAKPIRKAFSSFADALETAKRHWDAPGRKRAQENAA